MGPNFLIIDDRRESHTLLTLCSDDDVINYITTHFKNAKERRIVGKVLITDFSCVLTRAESLFLSLL
jgi:hypothetical protein